MPFTATAYDPAVSQSSNKQEPKSGVVEQRMSALGLVLPVPAVSMFNYVPAVLHQGVMYVSGQLPRVEGEVRIIGKVGAEVSVEQAQEAARLCILQGLAWIKESLGSLDRVERVLKLTGYVASAPGFVQQPVVIDAGSRLLLDVFGKAGRHARTAVGVAELPRNAPVEIELIVAIETREEQR